jgi:hypothetical protein
MDRFLSFNDLKDRGIVRNRVTLSRWIESQGFPQGVLLGPNTRRFSEREVENWLERRPKENEPSAELGGSSFAPP